jgi:sugar transferase (PEP-CTERM/EpsH1 system associated)
MDILFLSHCVPYPPNKGEKIRAFHEIKALKEAGHRVHLACFGRNAEDVEHARALERWCASVYAEVRKFSKALAVASLRFGLGDSINLAFYRSRGMRDYVSSLVARTHFDVAVAYALPMFSYTPQGLPVLFDMQDVDSEKWFEYSRMKRFGFLYRREAERLRRLEIRYAMESQSTFLTARQETALFRSLAPYAPVECMENGVDFEYFDPTRTPQTPELARKRFIVFVGTMDYFPNVDAACWFAENVMPGLRRRDPKIEFLIVGNNPSKRTQAISRLDGVSVTGGVADVRPYILQARAVVAPLRLARGIQNKVLEALALGRPVFATASVIKTFGDSAPPAVVRCDSVDEYVSALLPYLRDEPSPDPSIRDSMSTRFTWRTNINAFVSRIEAITDAQAVSVR